MTDTRRLYWARACLYSAWAFVILGGMVLCTCPVIPAIGLGLALIAVFLSRGYKLLAPLFAVLVTGFLTISKTRELQRQKEAKNRSIQAAAATNSLPSGLTTNNANRSLH